MSIHRSSAGDIGFGAMTTADRRAAVQREEHDRALIRQEQLAAQCSPLNNPQEASAHLGAAALLALASCCRYSQTGAGDRPADGSDCAGEYRKNSVVARSTPARRAGMPPIR